MKLESAHGSAAIVSTSPGGRTLPLSAENLASHNNQCDTHYLRGGLEADLEQALESNYVAVMDRFLRDQEESRKLWQEVESSGENESLRPAR